MLSLVPLYSLETAVVSALHGDKLSEFLVPLYSLETAN